MLIIKKSKNKTFDYYENPTKKLAIFQVPKTKSFAYYKISFIYVFFFIFWS